MNNLLLSIPTLMLCAVGYFASWKQHSNAKYTSAVLLLMLCCFTLCMYTACDFYLHEWDERYHALVAKHMMQDPLVPTLYKNPILQYDYRNWGSNHFWVHKQPLPLWTMAASMWAFGVNEIALRMPSVLITTLAVYLCFVIGSYVATKRVGYVTAFLFSVNGLIIELTAGRVATDHIDVYFMFFVALAIVFSILFVQKTKVVFNILAGCSIGAAILCKWLPALIVLTIWGLLVLDSGKFTTRQIVLNMLLLVAATVVCFLPWQLYIHKYFPLEAAWEASFNVKHFTEGL
jgi:4-amino-4-deoxy-L-arabinose transferase-like glycosyltransferase